MSSIGTPSLDLPKDYQVNLTEFGKAAGVKNQKKNTTDGTGLHEHGSYMRGL